MLAYDVSAALDAEVENLQQQTHVLIYVNLLLQELTRTMRIDAKKKYRLHQGSGKGKNFFRHGQVQQHGVSHCP